MVDLSAPHCYYACSAYPAAMIERLRALFIVLEEGSLNRAATRLHITQPSLTRQMQSLENEIGGPLLERQPSGVKPTALGQMTLNLMASILKQYDAALADLRRLARGQRTELRICYIGSAANTYLNPALSDLRDFVSGMVAGHIFPRFEPDRITEAQEANAQQSDSDSSTEARKDNAEESKSDSTRRENEGLQAIFKIHGNAEDYAKLIFWCFLAGFSERFVTDIISRFESQSSDNEKPSGS